MLRPRCSKEDEEPKIRVRRYEPIVIHIFRPQSAILQTLRRKFAPFPLDFNVFSNRHEDPDVHPFIARIDDELVGYGELWSDDTEREIELTRIIVRPSRRRSGIGYSLVSSLLEQAEAFGFADAVVRVVPHNLPAIHCYEKVGFVRVSSDDQDRFNERHPIEYVCLAHRMRE